INNLYNEINAGFRNEKLSELFGIKPGFATDIMTVNRICNTVVDQLTPLTDDELIQVQKSIQTPFVAEHLKKCNQQSLAKLEENKTKTGYILNETPKTEADKLFAEIMKKYQGKVVYVDFWATWCGPCRSGIERIKPLKEEMIGKDVAFVYLTNQTSPEKTYSAMIPDIKGEHYRLSTDEWNYLAAKFNISGIPHYVLVNKKGEVVKPKLGHYDNEELKKILEEEMK
ncbi:MAG: Redoxin family protein, partial [Bacteroidota bacterium]|nr:Redoxin family protein [Bacteroidota bacterium]